MNRARENLTQASHKLAEHMYKRPDATPGSPERARPGARAMAPAKKDEGVIDAEYVDVEDKK